MNELAEFLLARVGEDETVARAARGSGVHDDRPAVKEWIGLAANDWLGHSDALFPAPQP